MTAVFIILYSLAVNKLQTEVLADPNKEIENKNLLDDSYEVFYGEKSAILDSNKISMKLDDIGETAVLFNTKEFLADDFSVIDLDIENLPINYRPFLVWKMKYDDTIHQLELFQPDGSIKTNFLNRDPNWKGVIVEFGLRIAPQTFLGLSIPYEKNVIFETVTLRNSHFVKDYFILFDYWKRYDPLTYIILNRIAADEILPLYAQPFVFILAWMLICFILLRVVFKRNFFFVLAIFSWLFLEIFQINNMSKVSSWANNVYANDMKINVDQQLYDIANRVKGFLKLDMKDPDKLKQTKVLVLSTDKYQRARIIYHMLPVNSSYLDINLEIITQSKVSVGDYIMSMSLTGDPIRPFNGELVFPRKTLYVKEVWHDEIVSIMEVIR
jgi:hypothetical protein